MGNAFDFGVGGLRFIFHLWLVYRECKLKGELQEEEETSLRLWQHRHLKSGF